MRIEFEERLERELIAAARRATAGAAGAGRDGSDRRRVRLRPHLLLRPLPVALVALAAIAALAVAALVFPARDVPRPAAPPPGAVETTPPTPGPLPRQCDPAGYRGRMRTRLTSRGIDRRLYDAYGVLRRPQTAADRVACPAWSFGGLLNPSAIRFVGMDGDGHRIFLTPMAGLPDTEPALRRGEMKAPWEVTRLTGPRLCITIVYPNSSAGGPCHEPSWFGRGRFNPLSVRPGGVTVLLGIFSDGVTTVHLTHESGKVTVLSVRDNVAVLLQRGAQRRDGVLSYDLIGADGRLIVTRHDGALRQRDDGTVVVEAPPP